MSSRHSLIQHSPRLGHPRRRPPIFTRRHPRQRDHLPPLELLPRRRELLLHRLVILLRAATHPRSPRISAAGRTGPWAHVPALRTSQRSRTPAPEGSRGSPRPPPPAASAHLSPSLGSSDTEAAAAPTS